MILYVATSNPGKLRDFATAASDATLTNRIAILPLPDLQNIPAPVEDEPTFEGNATLKARFYSLYAPGQIVLADDSGLEVDLLNGAPGVRSARYAEDMAYPSIDPNLPTDLRNNLTLLHALSSTSVTPRTAQYRCVLAAARDGQILQTASGTVEGHILSEPHGAEGFGYDPLFYLPDHSQSMAQLDPLTRLSLSHRGRALAALLRKLDAS